MVTRVLEQITAWRESLINLNRNNRLLYFRPKETSTVRFEAPAPQDFLDRLGRGKGLEVDEPSAGDDDEPDGSEEEPAAVFSRLPARSRPDNKAVSVFRSRSRLRQTLRGLERRAKQEFTDRGLWVLYLAVGILDWTDMPRETGQADQVSSPLLLIPVQLSHDGAQGPFFLKQAEEDVAVNPALTSKLQSDFAITLPTADDFDEDDVDGFLAACREAVARKGGWFVRDALALSVFSFHKEVMYQDLKKNEDAIASHPVVRSLALGHRTDERLSFSPVADDDLDKNHPPESVMTVMDADSSQRRCLAAARDGRSYIIEGPPGTGKSQTIANLIADALGQGKSVLFVSEKAAALEVVHDRLQRVGLAEFALELHSHKATRKQVAQALGFSLRKRMPSTSPFSDTELQRLATTRGELSEYAAAINEIRQDLGKSLHQVLGELSALQSLEQPPAVVLPQDFSSVTLADIQRLTQLLATAWEPVTRGAAFMWRVEDAELTHQRRTFLVEQLDNAVSMLEEIRKATRIIADAADLPWRRSLDDSQRVVTVGRCVTVSSQLQENWLTAPSLEPHAKAGADLASLVTERRAAAEELLQVVGPQWQRLPANQESTLDDLAERLASGRTIRFTLDVLDTLALHGLATQFASVATHVAAATDIALRLREGLGAPGTSTIKELRRLKDLTRLWRESARPDALWLAATELSSAQEALAVLEPLVKAAIASRDAACKMFKDDVFNIDASALLLRFREVHHGLGKLRPAYWRDRRALRAVTKSGRARAQDIDGLELVVSATGHSVALAKAEREWASALGTRYYHSRDTDFSLLRRALSNAERCRELASGWLAGSALVGHFSAGATVSPDMASHARALDTHVAAIDDAVVALSPHISVDFFESSSHEALLDVQGVLEHLQNALNLWLEVEGISHIKPLPYPAVLSALKVRSNVEAIDATLAEQEEEHSRLLGTHYRGLNTDLAALASDLRLTATIRETFDRAIDVTTAQAIGEADFSGVTPLEGLLESWMTLEAALLTPFIPSQQRTLRDELQTSFDDAIDILWELSSTVDDIRQWATYQRTSAALTSHGLGAALEMTQERKVDAVVMQALLKRAVLEAWAETVERADGRLQTFRALERDGLAESFRDLDRRFNTYAVSRISAFCNSKRPRTIAGAAAIIASEADKQKRHMPTRTLIDQAGAVIQALKPCLMMSPLTVSQFLPPSMRFDIVVFDEASQVRPADAINCIYRGQQVVIAGDQKQLPPTPFFDRLSGDNADEWNEEDLPVFESVLDIAKGSGTLTPIPLTWHYRSQHEDLISYSNYRFYGGSLVTYPGATQNAPDLGLELFVVPGLYRRGGQRDNPVEADKVVERLVFHLQKHPHLSIGVVAFSEAQASTIENAIEKMVPQFPALQIMLGGDRLHGGFVKNLESVQGDERDIIVFSIGYGPDEVGKFTMNFGPINKPGGERRLNVAITRARRRVEIVSSVRAANFSSDLSSDGVRHLRNYLQFAEQQDNRIGVLRADVDPQNGDAESPFEEEVARTIRSWGYDVTSQVGCSDYRIDLAVRHPTDSSRYVLAVECDGAMYHSSKVARDRDRLRQEVLQRLGWTRIHRIWGIAWYRTRGDEEARLRRAIDAAIHGAPERRSEAAPTAPEPEDFDFPPLPSWVESYEVAHPSPPRGGLEFHEEGAQGELQRMIQAVVSVEGPVSGEVLLRRVRSAWGMGRAGGRARGAFETALNSLTRRRAVKRSFDGFYAMPDSQEVRVRSADASDDDTQRTIDEIPREEMRAAIRNLVHEVHCISEDELTARVAGIFGWARRGSDISEGLKRAVKRLVQSGELVRTPNGLVPGDAQGS